MSHYDPLTALRGFQAVSEMQSAGTERRLRMAQLAGVEQANQQQQQDVQDQQAFRQAMTDPSMQGKTIGQVADTLAQGGHISMKAYQGAKSADVEFQKNLAGLDQTQLENLAKGHAATQELYNNVLNMPDDQLAQNWPAIAQQYNSIPGNQKQPLDPNQPLSKQQLQQFGPLLSLNDAYIKNEAAKREQAAKSSGEVAKSIGDQQGLIAQNLGPAKSQADWDARLSFLKNKGVDISQVPAQYSPENAASVKAMGISPEKSATLPDITQYINNWLAERGLQNTPANYAKAHQAYTNETKVQPGVMRMEVLANTRPVQVVDPNDPNAVIYTSAGQAIKSGAASPQSAGYQAAKSTLKSATSGKIGEELAAFNTAIQHADLLSAAAKAMDNGDVRALNKAGNALGVQFGSDKVTNFNVIKNAYTREVTKALSAGHLTDSEIAQQGGTIPDNASPAQIQGAVQAYKSLMASKVQIRKQQVEQGLKGKPNYGSSPANTPYPGQAPAAGSDPFSNFGGTAH